MSKSKATPETVASTLNSIAEQITSPSLTRTERQQLRSRNALVPDQLVEMISQLAEQGNGTVLGMPYDVATASATLTQTSNTRTAVNVGRQTLQRMEDDMLQQRTTIADPTFAIYTALRRLVKTKAGNALSPAYEQMKSIVKNRPRKSRAKKTDEAASTAPASTPPSAPAVAAPAASAPSTQAAAPKAVASTSN
ncbi:MAG: hypothetical protein ACLQVI_37860 [Polyangiaceae bacterium]|jgi:hypothetical protein